jgi:AcrR family transcriptional regulator
MSSPVRTLRADAARNRELLLAAAEEAFGEQGLDVSVADIARRAGVAKGTFFRHFATKDDLVAAVVGHHVTALIEAGERLLDAPDPGEALLEFLTVAAAQRQQYDVSFLLRAGDSDARVVEVRGRLYTTIGALVDRARAGGAVRSDVTATDVILLMCAPNHVVEHVSDAAPDLWRRYVAIIFDGLRPEGAHPLPLGAPAAAH